MKITTETSVDRPSDEVFAVLSDYRRDPDWRAAVTAMHVEPDGPVTVGSRIVETLRFGGQTHVTTTTVTSVVAGERLDFEGGNATTIVRGSRIVVPQGTGTRVIQHLELIPRRGPMRLLGPLLAPLYRRVAVGDLEALRNLLEQAPVRASADAHGGR